ncbi:hypothetical protein F4604DRAFT_1927055 [Suillus subluteus]|nr:hypothetical protein F4604DRAFT_1927055 [Suillus subluteus]
MHCPYFPQYQLSDDPALIASLGANILKIDVFEECFMRWIPSVLTDFNDLFKSSKPVARPTHMHLNMKGERDSLRKMNKQQQASTAASSSDVEFVDERELMPKLTLGKHCRLTTPPLFPTQLLSDSDDNFNACLASSMSPTPPLFLPTPPLFSTHLASSMSPMPPLIMSSSSVESMPHVIPVPAPRVIPVHIPIYNPAKPQQRWPHGMYTVDMAIGFQQMAIPKLCSFYGQEQLFRLIFGDTPFVKTMYHDNHKAWHKMELTVLETHKLARCTEDGLWANYLAARRAALGLGSKKHSGRK